MRTDEAETETAGHLRDAFILKGCLRLSAHLLRETLAEYPMRFEIFVDEAPPPVSPRRKLRGFTHRDDADWKFQKRLARGTAGRRHRLFARPFTCPTTLS